MKQFVKRCKVANYTKQIKQISDKVEETSKTILQRRKTASLSLADTKAIVSYEFPYIFVRKKMCLIWTYFEVGEILDHNKILDCRFSYIPVDFILIFVI